MVGIGSLVLARRDAPPDLKISGPVSGTPTPTAERPDAVSSPGARTMFRGSGSWAMSALPACFRERERIRGTLAQLAAQLPPPRERLRVPAVVRAGECTIVVGEHDLWIARRDDRLRVPPEAALYRRGAVLTLVYFHGNRAEIRRY